MIDAILVSVLVFIAAGVAFWAGIICGNMSPMADYWPSVLRISGEVQDLRERLQDVEAPVFEDGAGI